MAELSTLSHSGASGGWVGGVPVHDRAGLRLINVRPDFFSEYEVARVMHGSGDALATDQLGARQIYAPRVKNDAEEDPNWSESIIRSRSIQDTVKSGYGLLYATFTVETNTSLAGEAEARAQTPLESVTVHLERLTDGWCGPDSKAPSKAVIDDISCASIELQAITRDPNIEVDDDGTVALEWERDSCAFTLTFCGNGYVVGTLSPRSHNYQPWRIQVDNITAIADRLEHPDVLALIIEDKSQDGMST